MYDEHIKAFLAYQWRMRKLRFQLRKSLELLMRNA
jgi:hypothetical protein